MFFLVLANDRPGALEQRLAHRQEHLDYWNRTPGALKIGGAMLEDQEGAAPKGSAFILVADDVHAARRLVAADPFSLRGIFSDDIRVEVLRPSIGEWMPA